MLQDPMSMQPACAAQIAFEDAMAILCKQAKPFGTEVIALPAAAGRRLAEAVISRIDGPRSDCAAMDGYAVSDADLASGIDWFPCAATIYAGDTAPSALARGATMRVMTGAPVPPGTDRVVMIEHCDQRGAMVLVPHRLGDPAHVRRRGCDFGIGQMLVDSGETLTPQVLVAVAAGDIGHVCVWRRPRVAIIATGDEIALPGTAAPERHKIPDSLSCAIAALTEKHGSSVVAQVRTGDDADEICRAFTQSAADIFIVAGGASHGDRDFGRSALAALGLELQFCDLAVKPGKPTWYGRIGPAHVLGLPGNPTAALTIARLFVVPLIIATDGGRPAEALQWQRLPLCGPIRSNGPREAFLCAEAAQGCVRVFDRQEASGQSRLARTNALVRREPFAPEQPENAQIDVLMF